MRVANKNVLCLIVLLVAAGASAQTVTTNGITFNPSNGYIGIGTTSPDAALEIYGGSATFQVTNGSFSTNLNANQLWSVNTPLYMNYGSTQNILMEVGGATGNVGIGTTSPNAPLDIATGSVSGGNQVYNALTVQPAGGSAYGANGASIFLDAVTNHGINPVAGIWSSLGSGGDGGVNYNGSLVLGTTPQGSSAPVEGMRLDPNGYVGIGTTTPVSPLHIASAVQPVQSTSEWGTGNLLIQGLGPRATTAGAALAFAVAANTDGSNPWEQGRIIVTPDNAATGNADGRMYLQTRALNPAGTAWLWNNNLMLTSNGAVTLGGNLALTAGSGSSITFPDATVQSTAWNGTTLGGDYAEAVDVLGDRTKYEPGDVIVIDDSIDGKFVKSATPYSRLVAGVYSTKPGLVGRRTTADRPDKDAEVPMAMMGIVPTKVSAENGPIERGDLLVSSSTPGYVMKGTDPGRMMGAVIGKALAPLKAGTGIIEVLVSLQ